MINTIVIHLDDKEKKLALELKGNLTWKELLLKKDELQREKQNGKEWNEKDKGDNGN